MKTRTKWLIAAAVIAATAGTAAAAEGARRHFDGERQRVGQMMFDRIDADRDGAITSEELLAALAKRFTDADANADSALTKAEAVAAIEAQTEFERARRHAGRIADRLFERLDLDGNGQLALSEIENRTKKVFALADFNDDGKVEVAELRRMGPGRHHGRGMEWRRYGPRD
jgi:Ca2+-binding EF-hand superfamily protein